MTDIEPFYHEFGKIMRGARIRKGFSQEDLARDLGLQRASISNIENARQRIYVHHMVQVCELLDIDINRLDKLSPQSKEIQGQSVDLLELMSKT